jgi:uncharacterized UBP type Zn finger protein
MKCVFVHNTCVFIVDVGSNNSGYYELNAVLTHKGRSSSSGHYVAWVRRKGGNWFIMNHLHYCVAT